jgi:hypothetical protein
MGGSTFCPNDMDGMVGERRDKVSARRMIRVDNGVAAVRRMTSERADIGR